MILGCANFCNDYRGKNIPKDEVFKLLEYFETNGGKLLDCAIDYNNLNVIDEYMKTGKLKLILKLPHLEADGFEVKESFSYIDCYMMRNYNYLVNCSIKKFNIKRGLSIYYPHEINQNIDVFSIPFNDLFLDYLPIMRLHAKVYARSYYQLMDFHKPHTQWILKNIDDIIIGVDNLDQLKQNMELFNAKV